LVRSGQVCDAVRFALSFARHTAAAADLEAALELAAWVFESSGPSTPRSDKNTAAALTSLLPPSCVREAQFHEVRSVQTEVFHLFLRHWLGTPSDAAELDPRVARLAPVTFTLPPFVRQLVAREGAWVDEAKVASLRSVQFGQQL
jgi:hypothetical protein